MLIRTSDPKPRRPLRICRECLIKGRPPRATLSPHARPRPSYRPSREFWLPPRFRTRNMASAAGTAILQNDGHTTLDENGYELLSDGSSDCDCCPTSAPPCSDCVTLPTSILLTATGLTICPDNCIQSSGTQNLSWTGTAPNGTFCLRPMSTCACMYTASAPNMTTSLWTHAAGGPGDCGTCTGTPDTQTAVAWFAEFRFDFSLGLVVDFIYGRLAPPPCAETPIRGATSYSRFLGIPISACNSFTVSRTASASAFAAIGVSPCDWTWGGRSACPDNAFGGSGYPVLFDGTITATANGC